MATAPLRNVDLNLLLVLDVLCETRSVARAASALGLTPSAVSHALARLRRQFGDPLFVRTAEGLLPTPRAEAARPAVRDALARLERVVGAATPAFDPRTATLTLRVGTSDFGARRVLPPLLATLAREAPGVQLVVRPLPLDPATALADGELDAMIGVLGRGAPGLYRRALFTERFCCMLRRGHPALRGGRLTLDEYAAAAHVVIAPRARAGGPVDEALAAAGRSRRVAVMVPEFLVAPFLVAETDLVLTAGERMLRSFEPLLPVLVAELPFATPSIGVSLVWHERTHGDAPQRWVRERLVEAHRAVYGGERADRARAKRSE